MGAVGGCASPRAGRSGGGGGDGGAAGDGALGGAAATLGRMCFGACGSADERKCSISSTDCASDLCLVDPASATVNYCTIDCTSSPCPAGWRCEAIQAFGHPEVQRACVAEPAMCGDGITQLGETCDADDPVLGRCVECMRFEARCGDGVVQSPEVCDGDTPDAYCAPGCSRLVHPAFSFDVNERVASAIDRVSGSTTYFYGTGYETGETLSGELPLAGGADGCGGVRVVEATSELTRLEWTYCEAEGDGMSIWTFALPRAVVTYDDWEGPIPPQLGASVTLRKRGTDRHVEWTMADMQRFEVRTYIADDPAHTLGSIQLRFEHPDPIQSFTNDTATLNLDVEMTHPVLAP